MAIVTPARKNIEINDVAFRSSISEAVGNKISAFINFINSFQYDKHSWNLNGPYSLGVGSTGTDGVFTFLFNVEVVGFSYYAGVIGNSGTTTVDVHWISGGDTDEGTIFTTKPSVTTTASDDTITTRDVLNSATLSNPTGHTLAVLNKTDFDAGDTLRLDLDDAMTGANNFQFTIFFRPR